MKLVEGRDYYIVEKKYIFTENYLLSRGCCCLNGCKHCPWKYMKEETVPDQITKNKS